MIGFLESVKNVLFPNTCLVCGEVLPVGKGICSSCLADMPLTENDFMSDSILLEQYEHRPSACYSLFYYDKNSNFHKLLHALKYKGESELGVLLGQMLGHRIKSKEMPDVIVPLPLHPKREHKRGYNQSERIAQGVAQVLNIPIETEAIIRVKDNKSQTGMNPEERRQNVSGIFAEKNKEKIQGCHVLLIDDVITTGVTMASCVDVLWKMDVSAISLGCLARTVF